MKLMIVDDHAGVRKMIRQLVALPTDVVCECASGEEAVQNAMRFCPEVVTMDVRMPGMCGLDAARAILQMIPSVRIIIVSSYDEPRMLDASIEAGCVDFLGKEDLSRLRSMLLQNPAASRSNCEPGAADGRSFKTEISSEPPAQTGQQG
jgi:DNA-binding NarL/FixJ family response regulator